MGPDGVVAGEHREPAHRGGNADGGKAGVAGRGIRSAVVHRRAHSNAGRHLVVQQSSDTPAKRWCHARVQPFVAALTVGIDAAGQVSFG